MFLPIVEGWQRNTVNLVSIIFGVRKICQRNRMHPSALNDLARLPFADRVLSMLVGNRLEKKKLMDEICRIRSSPEFPGLREIQIEQYMYGKHLRIF